MMGAMDETAKAALLAKLAAQRATFVETATNLAKAGIPETARAGFERATKDALDAFDRLEKSLLDA